MSGPFLSHFLIRETVREDYIIVFWCGGILQFISLILCIILKTGEFDYEKCKKNGKNLKEEKIDFMTQINHTNN